MKRIFTPIILVFLWVTILNFTTNAQSNKKIISPKEYFGFQPGADKMLINYEKLIGYMKEMENFSPRLKLEKIGESSMGKDMYIAIISSEENISNINNLKQINKRLALDPNIPSDERKSLIDKGKVFVLATLSMHSSEIGPSQSAPLIAYNLITANDQETLNWLNNVVLLMTPCHNPDGMNMVVNNYNKYKNTKYEGCDLPGVYHKYVGHNINRDFVTLTQVENKAIAQIYNTEWYPQVLVEKHQMGRTGVRYFVPPPHDPIAENIDAGIWNWMGVFGSNMIKDMTNKGLKGVTQHYLFDDYWPGSTETCIWKNVIGFLTEAASAKYASPQYVEQTELGVWGKGLSEYKKSINMPSPWEGGWWKLSNIVEYELASMMSIIKTASENREEILNFRNNLCKKEVKKGLNEPPFYYILPQDQHDKSEFVTLVNLLIEHGINVYRLNSSIIIENRNFKKGDIIVPLAQPFRSFVKEVMEKQKFPVRHYTPNGKVIKPYDITSWSLPLHREVTSYEINTFVDIPINSLKQIQATFSFKKEIPKEYWAAIFDVNNNESFKAAFSAIKSGIKTDRLTEKILIAGKEFPEGSFLINQNSKLNSILQNLTVSPEFIEKQINVKATSVSIPRIALVETYIHDMDAGWTRFIFDNHNIPYKVIRPGDFENIEFIRNYDLVIFPDESLSAIKEGKDNKYIRNYPPEFRKKINDKGMKKLTAFIDNGGIIISWGRSAPLFIGKLSVEFEKDKKEEFLLPVKDVSKKLKEAGLFCPGSLLKLKLIEDHPLTLGMKKNAGILYRGGPVFTTSIPIFDMDRRIIGSFPEENILISGYCENQKELAKKTGVVWLKKGKGQIVLFGFSPIFRSSTRANYKLVFNALLLPKIK